MAILTNLFGKKQTTKVMYNDSNFSAIAGDRLQYQIPDDREIVFVCLGTDKLLGDSFGPMIGQMLQERGIPNVYGTLSAPCHSGNWRQHLELIDFNHDNPFIIAIDASVGKFEKYKAGEIHIGVGGVRLGTAVNNQGSSPMIGNLYIAGEVTWEGDNKMQTFENLRTLVPVSLIYGMSKAVSDSLVEVLSSRQNLPKLSTAIGDVLQ